MSDGSAGGTARLPTPAVPVAGATDADALVVGAGPAGATCALVLARAGHRVLVLDQAHFPRDKACGEGLLPGGVGVLRRLGLIEAVLATGACRLEGVTYTVAGCDARVSAPFPQVPADGGDASGLGVRRLTFDHALARRLAAEPGIVLLEGVRATGLDRDRHGTVSGVRTDGGCLHARVTVAADGLHSRLRRAAGWGGDPRGPRRYGVAGHWRLNTDGVTGITVTLADDGEWYQAPVGPSEMLVSRLGTRRAIGSVARDYAGAVREALPEYRGAGLCGPPRSAGLFQQRPTSIAGERLFLAGDAAGYDDPATGEGIGMAMMLGELLGGLLCPLLDGSASLSGTEARYRARYDALWRDRRRVTRLARMLATHPSAARRAVRALARRPATLTTLLGINCGYWGFDRLSARDWLALAGI